MLFLRQLLNAMRRSEIRTATRAALYRLTKHGMRPFAPENDSKTT
jgi:hypothetical protein